MRYAAMDQSLGRGTGPATAIFPAAREAELDGVELCLGSGYVDDPLWSLPSARTTATAARDSGLDLPSFALLMLNAGGFSGDARTRERARDIVRHAIAVAHELAARLILLPFFGAGTIEGTVAIDQVTADLRSLAPVAEQAGVRLGIETTLRAPTVVGILRLVDSRAVTAYFDIANAVWLGYDPVAELETLSAADALPQIHVKDIQDRPGDRPLGQGRVSYPAVATALRRLGYDGYLVFETTPTAQPATAARHNVVLMERYLE